MSGEVPSNVVDNWIDSPAAQWFQSPLGQYLLEREQDYFDRAVADVFGYNAFQLGVPEVDLLRGSRIPLRAHVAPHGPVDPGPQEALSFRPEDGGVEGEQMCEWHRGQLNQAFGALASAHRAPADVAVREHEAAALVGGLLSQHPVQPDDPPAGAAERALEQAGPDAATAHIGAHDVKPDEGVRVAVEHAGDRPDDLALTLGRDR